jgi:DNA-directed RNA polymerase subunit F
MFIFSFISIKNLKMKEDFLHYLWKFKKFDTLNLKTVQGELVTIIKTGDYLQRSGS